MPSANLDQAGTFSPFKIRDWSLDRYNVAQGQVDKQAFITAPAGSSPIDDDLINPDSAPDMGVPCVAVKFAQAGSIATYTYFYEGLPAWASEGESFFELEGSDTHEPIETHPEFAEDLKIPYKAVLDLQGRFSHFDPLDAEGHPNALYGCTEYLTTNLVWRRTRTLKDLPADLMDNVDCVDEAEGDEERGITPPALEEPRNWLRLAPQARFRGNVWLVTETWMASGRRGWNEDVYKTA